MALIRSAAYALVFYSFTVFAVLGAFVAAAFGPRVIRPYAVGWARVHRWCAAALLGVRTRIEGEPPAGLVLVAAKHQSMFETLELLRLLHEPAVVVKRELAEIPLWGKVARSYGVIPIDRAGSARALREMLRSARAAAKEGRAILIFPEGTRVEPGEKPELRAGFAGLYSQLGLPVVPVALDSGRLWPRGFVKRAGIVTFRFGEPIAPGLPRAEAEARVHAAINALEK
jgi:1-acyl-sn-glycerol-3-phosphate acyltransferase